MAVCDLESRSRSLSNNLRNNLDVVHEPVNFGNVWKRYRECFKRYWAMYENVEGPNHSVIPLPT